MIDWFAALQPLFAGIVFGWAGLVKLLGRQVAARRSALRRLVGEERVVVAYRSVGGVELAIGGVLIVFPATVGLGLAWSIGLVAYLGYARIWAPQSSCGCLGSKAVPVRARGFARAGLLVLATGVATVDTHARVTPAAAVFLVVELALVVVLSPELDDRWLLPLRRWRVRRSHPLAGKTSAIPVVSSVHQLVRSRTYRSVGALLRSDLQDTWEEDDWRILTYVAEVDGRRGTAVFAVPLTRYEPDEIRFAIVH